jgi:hypothetical protein|tara:strand:+ start:754 stop:1353 length:600 start_codon:yes stop_codon:yes gene_type:complete
VKFYNLEFGPYGSESVIGTISESQYSYWSKNADDLSEYLNVFDHNNEGIPKSALIEQDWFEIDDVAHANGPLINDRNNINFSIIQTDINGLESSRKEFDFDFKSLFKIKIDCISKPKNKDKGLDNKPIFIGHAFEKGIYYLDELIAEEGNELIIEKLKFHYQVIQGHKILYKVSYGTKDFNINGDTVTNSSNMLVHKNF